MNLGIALVLGLCVSLLTLTACSGDETGPEVPPAASFPVSVEASAVRSTSVPPGSPPPTGTVAPGLGFQYPGYQLFGDFTYEDPIPFPENLMLIVETGCTQCDGWAEALYRVWRNEGETHVDLLADASIAGIEGAAMTGFALRPTAHDIVVSVCNQCGDLPLTSSSTTLYRSIDGGVTWRAFHETGPGEVIFPVAITDEGIVLGHLGGGYSYFHGEPVTPPPGAEALLRDSRYAGELRWLAEGGSAVLDISGMPIARVEPGSSIDSLVVAPAQEGIVAVGWGIGLVDGPFKGWAVTGIGPDGRLAGFRTDTVISPAAHLPNGTILGGISDSVHRSGGLVGQIDAKTGKLTPFGGALVEPPFGDGVAPEGRNRPVGARQGPFMRIAAGSSCVPVRESTDVDSDDIACLADGVLVLDQRNRTTLRGQEWHKVQLLDGREAVIDARYIATD